MSIHFPTEDNEGNKGTRTRASASWAVIALGSNQGASMVLLARAVGCLRRLSDHPLRVSSPWLTSPVDCPPGSPEFLNAVVLLQPRALETPLACLERLLEIEQEFGRQPKKVLNEPRPLDLDLVAFGNEVVKNPRLCLPHPRAHQRRFVLAPLSEIAPDWVLPGQTETVAALLARLPAGENAQRLTWPTGPSWVEIKDDRKAPGLSASKSAFK